MSNKTPLSKINFKLNTGLKQSLKLAKECIEKRLQEDQKAIRRQRKIQKMQELLISKDNINDVKTRLVSLIRVDNNLPKLEYLKSNFFYTERREKFKL